VDSYKLKTPWNLNYASYDPERRFSHLLIQGADLFESFVRMPDRGLYSFPYSYKPEYAARTHVRNENFNPDFFLRLKGSHDILVVEIKGEEDRDRNRTAAKFRDGRRHFETLNEKLVAMGEPWRYHFHFLSPDDFTSFFEQIRARTFAGWRSSLMQELDAGDRRR
jgi:type III restriction enzyme